jgi:hypothetical protein
LLAKLRNQREGWKISDNTILPGTGETVRDKDRAGVKTQIVGLDLGIGGTETLMNGSLPTAGDVAHDAADAGNPVKVGMKAIAYAAQTAVAAGDRHDMVCDRHGSLFVIGGHPDVVTLEAATTGAQTDVALVTVSAGTRIVVTQVQIVADNANTAFPQVRIGFGAANTPTTTGVVATHPGVPAGGGVARGSGSGILGVGADGEDLRITNAAPTGGSLRVLVTYYTVPG